MLEVGNLCNINQSLVSLHDFGLVRPHPPQSSALFLKSQSSFLPNSEGPVICYDPPVNICRMIRFLTLFLKHPLIHVVHSGPDLLKGPHFPLEIAV